MSNTINVNYMTRAYNQYQQKNAAKDQEKEDTRFADSVREKSEASGSIVGNSKIGSVSAKDMTMVEYKQYIYNKISQIPMHPTRAGESISVTISEAGFEAMKNDLGEKKVIAENLGFLTDSVHKLLDDTGFPGMNVLEFAFGAYDDSIYLPHKYKENSVVYTGTHDNDTVVGWYETLSEDDKKFLEHYLKYSTIERTGTVHLDLISLALESRSDMVIIPLQDYLVLGYDAWIYTPSTVGDNWEWRVKEEQLTDELKELIRTLTIKYRTVAEENAKKAAEEAQQ